MRGMGATPGTGATGSTRGFVGATPTGVEIGLNAGKIGQLGISTDYGGGIVIGIFGQKIVWGREGGKIHYNFGGLEVIVEARNCVVVESRKIFGQVVDRHVYPDPGCKLPPEAAEEVASPSLITLPAITAYQCLTGQWILGGRIIGNKLETPQETMQLYLKSYTFQTINPNLYPRPDGSNPNDNTVFRAQDAYYANLAFGGEPYDIVVRIHKQPYRAGNWYFYLTGQTTPKTAGPGDALYFFCCYYIDIYIKRSSGSEFRGSPYNHFLEFEKHTPVPPCPIGPIIATPVPPNIPLPFSLPPGGNQPPMPDSCCESLKADIEDIKEVLATKEILAGKMTFPWKWRMPGGQGEEIIMDYPNLLRAIAQMIDHLSIHPPKLTIKDINNAVAGNQSLSNQFPSVTQAFEALMAQVWDANADVDTLTNFLYRLAWLNVQQSFNMAQLTGSVESLKDMIGGETEPLETELTTPFNIAAGTGTNKMPPGKGFGKPANQIDNRIDANTEMATEAMLPEFLKIRENPILVDTFSGKQDIFDILLLIRADLETLKNK